MKKTLAYFTAHWFAFLLLVVGLHITVFQIFGYNLRNVIGDLGDSRFILAITEYNYQWMMGHYSNYWDGFFMYPDKEVISYSDNLLGVLPVYSIFRSLGIQAITAFQWLIITSHVLNFIFCYYCFYKISSNKQAAAAGAFLFAFSIVLNGIHNHPQYTFRFAIPLFFYFFYTYLFSFQIKQLIFATLALVYQFYLGIYLGYFLLVSAGVFTFSFLLFHPQLLKQYKTIVLQFLSVLPLALLLLPLFYFYYKRNQITGGYYTDYAYYMETIPRLSSYFKAFEGSLIWNFLSETDVPSKYEWFHVLFPGALILFSLFLAFVFVFQKQKMMLVLLLIIFLFVAFTTYYEGHTMYGYLMKIPGIKAARIVSRVVTVLVFFAAWLFCFQLDFIQKKFKVKQSVLILLLPILLVLDNYCFASGFKTFTKLESNQRVRNIQSKLTQNADLEKIQAFAYLPPTKTNISFFHIDAMLCALELRKKTINGYSSSCDRYFGPFWKNGDSLSLAFWLRKKNLPADSVLVVH